jgi:hypothetical protein
VLKEITEGGGEATAVETFASGATRPTVALARSKDRTWVSAKGCMSTGSPARG